MYNCINFFRDYFNILMNLTYISYHSLNISVCFFIFFLFRYDQNKCDCIPELEFLECVQRDSKIFFHIMKEQNII